MPKLVFVAGIVVLAVLLAALPERAHAAVTFTVETSVASGRPLYALDIGDVITIDVTMRSDGEPVFAVGGAISGFSPDLLQLESGITSSAALVQAPTGPGVGFGGLDSSQSVAVQSAGDIQFFNGVSISGTPATGAADISPITSEAGGPQARIVVSVTALGSATLTVGALTEFGDAVVGQGGVFLTANNATIDISVGPDTDEDGLTDYQEINTYGTDPLVPDTDGDGLSDGDEVLTFGTNPLSTDSDGDTLSDREEIETYLTNPIAADTDGDGISDGDEINRYFTDPLVSDADLDSDGDGLTNVAEVGTHGTNPTEADSDSDGLTDGEELLTYGTDPLLSDTDGDGLSDGDEVVLAFTDPLNPNPLAAPLNSNAATDSGQDTSPAIETDGLGNFLAVWRSTDDLSATIGSDADLLTARSSDNGRTWTAPMALNTNAATDAAEDLGAPVLKTDRLGVWIAAWASESDLDGTVGTDRDILFARSTDNGATWSDPAAIDPGAGADSGSDEQVSLAFGDGVFVAVWQTNDAAFGPDLEVVFSRSTDGGLTWSPATSMSANPSDDRGPTVASDGLGNWVAVWESDEGLIGGEGDLLTARSSDGGATWSAARVLNSNAIFDAGADLHPRLAADGSGNWLLVWDSDEDPGGALGPDRDVFFARSTNNGATWTAPAALVASAATDSGDDLAPDVSTDSNGGWYVVWESDEDAAGVLGTDSDLLIARSFDAGNTWSSASSINQDAIADSAGDHAPRIATQPSGSSVVVWQSDADTNGLGPDFDVFFAAGLYPVDTDGDGLTDADEVLRYGTDPLVADADRDTDGDGLSDVDEIDLFLTDPLLADTDGDGLSDGDEHLVYATDPLVGDSDGDGLSDGEEVTLYGTDPTLSDVDADTDGDGLTNREEVEVYRTDPIVADLDADTDGDGLLNVAEVTIYFTDPGVADATADTDGDGLTNVDEVDLYFTDPNVADATADTDGDGLTNVDEVDRYFTDPTLADADADTDGDGLANVDEVDRYFTDPVVADAGADTDGDGLSNVDEVDRYLTNPQVSDAAADTDGDGITNVAEVDLYLTDPGLADLDADTDGDGLSNVDEIDAYGTDPGVSDADTDTDGDGLSNVAEVDLHGTDRLVADTDGDGLDDGVEVNVYGTNPAAADTDGDGFSDGEEINVRFTDPLTPDPPVFALNTNASEDSGSDVYAETATDGFGNWITVWRSNDDLGGSIGADYDILLTRSINNGLTWSPPAPLNSNAASDSGADLPAPVVLTDRRGAWIAAWATHDDLDGTIGVDGDIVFARSIDNGLSWTAPTPLDSGSASDSSEDDRVALAYGDGVFVALWQSDDGGDLEIEFSRSTNGGRTWTAASAITANTGNDSLPNLASDGLGNWVAVWESDEGLTGGDGDLLTARSSDGGASWTAPAILNTNALTDLGSDLRPRIATDGFGTWLVVWDSDDDLSGTIGSDRDVLFATSTDNGATWTDPAALESSAFTDTGDELNPDPTTDITGSWTVVWESNEDLGGAVGSDFDLFVSSSSDDGNTWSAAVALTPEATTDLGGDYFPRVATQPGGPSIVVWHSDEDAFSAIGTDWDLFFSDGLESDAVADCDATGPLAPSTGTLGVGESHYCEDWSLVSQPASDLRDSFLVRIDLSGAVLNGSLLLRADLTNADLSNAAFFNANLGQAILAGANLTNADLSFAAVAGAFYDQNTTFPSGGNLASADWGLPNASTPWDLGMVPVPEPTFGLGLMAGLATLVGLRRRRGDGGGGAVRGPR